MGNLTTDQRDQLRRFLVGQGLTFKPLQEEMLDHVSCDLEDRMANGASFEKAWQEAIDDIPKNHFQTIQNETMENINGRYKLAMPFSYLALGLLFMSMTFKILHYPLSGELLLASFVIIGISLLSGSLSGIKFNREKRGGFRILAIVAGVLVMMAGYGFKVLQLPGADWLVLLSVIILITSLIATTIYFYRNADGEGNLLTYLHEKYTPGIERFFLILLAPLALYRIITILNNPTNFAGLILLIVMFGAGLQFIALNWRMMENNLEKRTPELLITLIVTFLCFILVFLGPLINYQIRVVMIMIFSVSAAWLAYRMEASPKNIASMILVVLVPVIFVVWGLITLQIIPSGTGSLFFNLPVLILLGVGLFLCKKHGTMRTYMIISFASYLFEYIVV
jgi:hypothetical protein